MRRPLFCANTSTVCVSLPRFLLVLYSTTAAFPSYVVARMSLAGPHLRTTLPPGAMTFDLVPLAEDRFRVEVIDEVAVIDRDADGRPQRFVTREDLERHVQELEAAGDTEGATRERAALERLFASNPTP